MTENNELKVKALQLAVEATKNPQSPIAPNAEHIAQVAKTFYDFLRS